LRWLLALAVVVMTMSPPPECAFADEPRQAVQVSEDQLFQQLLANPTDVELNLRYAVAAQRQGNVEGAISALERILAAHPDLANVRLKLGQLYAQLGSYTMALAYLEPLAASDSVPAAVKADAAAALREVNAQTARSRFSGTLFAGSQWQNNPGAAPGAPFFLVAGVPQQVRQSFAKRPDNDLFAQASGQYVYDLQTPDHDTIEADGLAYVSSFRRLHQLDTVLGNVSVGPQLGLERIGLLGGSLRPYLLLSDLRLGGAAYEYAGGAGFHYAQKLGAGLPSIGLGYEAQQASYISSNNFPTAAELDGRLDRYQLTFAQSFGSHISAELGTVVNRQNTRLAGYSNTDYALVGNLALSYDTAPFSFGYPLVTALGFSRHYIPYDGADPTVAPGITRTDRRWQFSVGEIVPVTGRISVVALLARDIETSNIRNFAYTNTSFMVGPQVSF